jgi:hypothetical protein
MHHALQLLKIIITNEQFKAKAPHENQELIPLSTEEFWIIPHN